MPNKRVINCLREYYTIPRYFLFFSKAIFGPWMNKDGGSESLSPLWQSSEAPSFKSHLKFFYARKAFNFSYPVWKANTFNIHVRLHLLKRLHSKENVSLFLLRHYGFE